MSNNRAEMLGEVEPFAIINTEAMNAAIAPAEACLGPADMDHLFTDRRKTQSVCMAQSEGRRRHRSLRYKEKSAHV